MTQADIVAMLAGFSTTHMPFLVSGGPFLFCTADGTGSWRAHQWNGTGVPVVLGPDPPVGGVQCCPVGEMLAGSLAWSFVGTYPGAFSIHTHQEIRSCGGAGYVLRSRASRSRKILVEQGGRRELRGHLEAENKTFRFGKGWSVLAATPADGGTIATVHRIGDGNRAVFIPSVGDDPYLILTADGIHPYKPCLAFGGLFHAAQNGPRWEDRQIVFSPAYKAEAIPAGMLEQMPAMPTLLKGGRYAVL